MASPNEMNDIESTIIAMCNSGNLVIKTLKKGGNIRDWKVVWQRNKELWDIC